MSLVRSGYVRRMKNSAIGSLISRQAFPVYACNLRHIMLSLETSVECLHLKSDWFGFNIRIQECPSCQEKEHQTSTNRHSHAATARRKRADCPFPRLSRHRIGPRTPANLLIEQRENDDVLATWSPRKDQSGNNPLWVSIRSPFGGTARVYAVNVKLDPPIGDLLLPPQQDRFVAGDLILVTVTITVPATTGQEEIVETFEIEATTILLP